MEDLLTEVNNRKQDIEAMDADFYSQMTEQDRLELYTLNNNLLREARNYNKFKDKTLKQRSLDEIKRIKESINEIENRYDRQKEAGIPSPIVEGEAPIEAQPIEGAGQETPEAGGVLQVPIEEGVEATKEEIGPAVEDITFGTAFDLQDKTAVNFMNQQLLPRPFLYEQKTLDIKRLSINSSRFWSRRSGFQSQLIRCYQNQV